MEPFCSIVFVRSHRLWCLRIGSSSDVGLNSAPYSNCVPGVKALNDVGMSKSCCLSMALLCFAASSVNANSNGVSWKRGYSFCRMASIAFMCCVCVVWYSVSDFMFKCMCYVLV